MRRDECLFLLGRSGAIIWAKKAGVVWLGGTPGGLLETVLPTVAGGAGTVADWLAPIGKAFRAVAAGRADEGEGMLGFRKWPARDPLFTGGLRLFRSHLGISGCCWLFSSCLAILLLMLAPFAARLFGFGSPLEMIGKLREPGTGIFTAPDQKADLFDLLGKVIVEGFQLAVVKVDKTEFWIAADARAVREPTSPVVFFEGCLTDVSRRKREELEWERLRPQLRVGRSRVPTE